MAGVVNAKGEFLFSAFVKFDKTTPGIFTYNTDTGKAHTLNLQRARFVPSGLHHSKADGALVGVGLHHEDGATGLVLAQPVGNKMVPWLRLQEFRLAGGYNVFVWSTLRTEPSEAIVAYVRRASVAPDLEADMIAVTLPLDHSRAPTSVKIDTSGALFSAANFYSNSFWAWSVGRRSSWAGAVAPDWAIVELKEDGAIDGPFYDRPPVFPFNSSFVGGSMHLAEDLRDLPYGDDVSLQCFVQSGASMLQYCLSNRDIENDRDPAVGRALRSMVQLRVH